MLQKHKNLRSKLKPQKRKILQCVCVCLCLIFIYGKIEPLEVKNWVMVKNVSLGVTLSGNLIIVLFA